MDRSDYADPLAFLECGQQKPSHIIGVVAWLRAWFKLDPDRLLDLNGLRDSPMGFLAALR
jgi:hypothetical protein